MNKHTLTAPPLLALAAALALAGCSSSTPTAKQAPPVATSPPAAQPKPAPRSEDKPVQQETITVTGVARDAKQGAMLEGEERNHWIGDLEAWPDDMLNKRVKVTGRLEKRADQPVFHQLKPGEPQVSGIPVPEGTDLKAASVRQVITGARWELAE